MPSAKKRTGNLPTNIEQLTSDFVQHNLSTWNDKIVQALDEVRRASESDPAQDEDLLFLRDVETRARAEGRSPESVLQEYTSQFKQSTYPSPECLFPDEVAEYFAERYLPEQRLQHAERCIPCAALLAAALPAAGRGHQDNALCGPLDDMLFRRPPATPATRRRDPVPKKWIALPTPVMDVLNAWAAMIWPAIVVLTSTYFVLLSLNRRVARLTMPENEYFWIVTVAGSFACIIAFRGFRSIPRLQPVIAGCVLGVVFASYLVIDYRDNRATAVMAFDWAQTKAEQFTIKAMEQKQSTDAFPNQERAAAFFESVDNRVSNARVELSQSSRQEAKYVVTVPKLPGKIMAEVGANSGKITIDDGGKTPTEIQLVLGTIQADAQSPLKKLIVADKGGTYKVQENQNVLELGTRVIAVVDPQQSSVARVVSSSFTPQRRSLNPF